MSDAIVRQLNRRYFLQACVAAAIAGSISSRLQAADAGDSVVDLLASTPSSSGERQGAIESVRPIIGTGWHGHTFPGATMPFGLVQLSPDTAGPNEAMGRNRGQPWDSYFWDHCGGYHYPDTTIIGFSHTHISGTGGVGLGDVLIMPMVEGRNWNWNASVPGQEHEAQLAALGADSGWVSRGGSHGYCSSFSHQQEVVRPGYYSVYLQTPRIKAELTATTRCGMHRYTYPAVPDGNRRGAILDLVHGLGDRVYHAELNIESRTRISGKRYTHGWAKNKQVYFVIEFSKPFTTADLLVNGKAHGATVGDRFTGVTIKAIFSHDHSNAPLIIRVAISCTSVDGARKNLRAEIPHWNFDKVTTAASAQWNQALGVLDAQFTNSELTETFYTSAYHGMIGPTTFNDVDGSYRGADRKNHRYTGFTNYTTISIWDIYRGEFPFIMLTQPRRTNDIINTALADYRQLDRHALPMWPLWGNETWSMMGFHVVAMIAGAYARGFRGYDVEAVYAAMRDTAMVGTTANNNRAFQEQFRTRGYVASAPGAQSVLRTLDFAYDYWCVGAMAEMLGKHDDAKMFYKLGRNYKNLFDPKTGFMRGKLANGQWREPFRPDEDYYYHDYTESDSWQATFNVMQDVQGLIELYGGEGNFIAKLDAFFTTPSHVYKFDVDITGMVGQDAQGNEPSNHIPYLYPFAGAAWKTQYWIRKVLALYNNTPNGIPGNDDIGQLSSCFTLGALGFYPVNAATGVYIIGSPLVDRARIVNPVQKTVFTIVAENNSRENCYIQSARLNGRELNRSWFTHADIVAGGELHFQMSGSPNKDWASAKVDRPPSGLVM